MPKTVVKCSMPGCKEAAAAKVASPWKDGSNAELKTYGYTCSAHAEPVVSFAQKRPQPRHLSPSETVGAIAAYPLG